MDNDRSSAQHGDIHRPRIARQSDKTEDAHMGSHEPEYQPHSFSTSVTSTLSGALDMGVGDSAPGHDHGHASHSMQWSEEDWQTSIVGSPLREPFSSAEATAGPFQAWSAADRIEGSDLDWSFLSNHRSYSQTSVSQDDAGWFVPASQQSSTELSVSTADPSSQSSSVPSHSFDSNTASSRQHFSTASSGGFFASCSQPRDPSLPIQGVTTNPPRSSTKSSTLSPATSSHTLMGLSTSSSPVHDMRQPTSPIDSFSEQYSTFSLSDMDWSTFVQASSDASADQYPRSHDTSGLYIGSSSSPNTATPSSSVIPVFKHATTAHRLERLPEEDNHTHLQVDRVDDLDPSHSLSQQADSLNPTSKSTSRRMPGARSSLGSTLSHLRQKSSRQGSTDASSSVRQVYSTSHGRVGLDTRGNMSGNSNSNAERATAMGSLRKRAGTLDIPQSNKGEDSTHRRLASSVPDPDLTPLASNFSEKIQGSGTSDWQSSLGAQSHRTAHDLPASITADFESLGLDLAQYAGGVQDVTMGDMYGDGVELLKSSDHGSYRESSIGTGDASFASTSSSTLESSGLEDSILVPGMSERRSWTEDGTPLSSPAFSAHLQLYPSPGPSRYSSFSSSHQKHSGPADKGKGRASEFGVLPHQPSSTVSWPHCGDSSSQAHLQSAARASSVSGVPQAKDHLSRRLPAGATERSSFWASEGSGPQQRTEMQSCRSVDALQEDRKQLNERPSARTNERPSSMGSMRGSRSGMKSSASPLTPLRQGEAQLRHSMTSSAKSTASPFSSLRAGGKRVDYDEVSDALETLRKFLQQRDSKEDSHMSLPASLPTDEFTPRNRTLRHTSGKLPPRGSVRLDGTSSATTHGSGRSTQSQRRQHASFLSTSDEHAREQDRLDAVQHLSERVRVLRQRSQRFQQASASGGAQEPRQRPERRKSGAEAATEYTGPHQHPTKDWTGGAYF